MMGRSNHQIDRQRQQHRRISLGAMRVQRGVRREEEEENARSTRGRNINVTAEGSCDEIREVKAHHG